MAGRISGIAESSEWLEVKIALSGSENSVTHKVQRIIKCTGPLTDITKFPSKLYSNLLRKKIIRPDDMKLGVDATAEGRIIDEKGNVTTRHHHGGPLNFLRELLNRYKPVALPGLPRFYGGAVGYLGYEMVRYFEELPPSPPDDLNLDDAVFIISDSLMIFDNVRHTIKVVACTFTEDEESLEAGYAASCRKIEEMIEIISASASHKIAAATEGDVNFQSNMTCHQYKDAIEKAKEYIAAGDIIQVVLSQRFETEYLNSSIDLYRALRFINPSPYLFFLKMDDLTLIGSSPEVMVRKEDDTLE